MHSWNAGFAKQSIIGVVEKVTKEGTPEFVPIAERIAVFDNDGTLWPEQPVYVQLAFALDRAKALAPKHPEWKKKQPFKAALEGDMKTLAAAGERALIELVLATHAGMTTDERSGSMGSPRGFSTRDLGQPLPPLDSPPVSSQPFRHETESPHGTPADWQARDDRRRAPAPANVP